MVKMNQLNISKGEYEYPIKQRNKVLIRTFVYFLLPILIFVMGYLSTKTKTNLLTVVAIVGLLPGCKSLVNLIMFFLIPKFDINIYKSIKSKEGNVKTLYSLFLTSEKKNFPITCLAVKSNTIIGYSEFENFNSSECIKHIEFILKQNAIKNVNVTFFENVNKFENRLEQMQKLKSGNYDNEILSLLCDISL